MKRSRINQISDKRYCELIEYRELIAILRGFCDNKSELSGKNPDWQTDYDVEPHHIGGRIGDLFLNPFNIIMLVRDEHTAIENELPIDGHKYTKDELLRVVAPLRIAQGFRPMEE